MSKGELKFQEIFSTGRHTDSAGREKVWTEAELDEVVANFDGSDLAPMVIGHPKHDSPAFGWVRALKREGKRLLAQLDPTEAFTGWVKAGHLRNRSVSLVKAPAGYKLGHVGFLGGATPAVAGMPALEFKAEAGETYEFAMNDGYWLSQIARGMRRLREFLIAEYGQDKADRVTPSYDIEDLERKAGELLAPVESNPVLAYTAPPPPEAPVEKQFTQADLDAAIAAARGEAEAKTQAAQAESAQLKHAARLAENRAFVQTLVTNEKGEVRLTPAQAEGLPECLTHLQGLAEDTSTFAFTAADQSAQQPSAYEFVKNKLTQLAPQMRLGHEQATTDPSDDSGDHGASPIPSGYSADPVKVALDRKARQYMAAHNTDYVTAVFAVEKAG